MAETDLADGLRLCRAANWNQLEDDWRVFLDCGGAFVAVESGAVVGSVAYLPFGGDFAWLSMMLVNPAARRSGIGTRLMEACLDAIGPDIAVRLDATPLGEPLYRRFGFVDEYPLARARTAPLPDRAAGARPIRSADLPSILARDRQVFGADRSVLLSRLFRRVPELAWRTDRAYCFGRPGYIRPQIGPLVADDLASARELLGSVLAAQDGATMFTIDIPQSSGGLGFAPERPFVRMRRGGVAQYGRPEHVFAITGPEFG